MIEVIIAVRDRPEATVAIFSLLSVGDLITRVILVDASLTGAEGKAIRRLCPSDRLLVIHQPMERFSKSSCLNVGLNASTADLILVSDAEIVWFSSTIAAMKARAARERAFCHVSRVEETKTPTAALSRKRIGFRTIREPSSYLPTIEIGHAPAFSAKFRPGIGLVMATRAAWFEIGGYVEDFEGWGWEDQDLLMRAALLNFHTPAVGRAIHVTHEDERRDVGHHDHGLRISRNKNLLVAIAKINAGSFYGPLKTCPDHFAPREYVKVVDDELKIELEANQLSTGEKRIEI